MDNSSANIDLIRSHVDIIILKPLENQDRYGYEILKEIETNSNGLFKLKQPTMYSCLKRLEKQGYINSYLGDESNGAQRRYYSLTAQGKDFLASSRAQWEFVRTVLGGLVSNTDFDKDNDVPPFDPSKYRPLTKRTRNEEENVKVVKEVVYVPAPEEKKPLTPDEIKDMLSEDDIDEIAKSYLDKHPELKTVEDEQKDDAKQEDKADEEESTPKYEEDSNDLYNNSDYLNDYNDLSDNDYVEEDVALDSNYDNDESYNDDTRTNSDVLDELLNQQTNNIEENNDNTEEKPLHNDIDDDNPNDNDTQKVDVKNPDEIDEDEENSRFISYVDENVDDEKDDTNERTNYQYQTFVPTQPIKIDDNPADENHEDQLFDYSKNIKEEEEEVDSVNVLNALDLIYSPLDEDKERTQDDENIDENHMKVAYDTTAYNSSMTIADLKAKFEKQGIKVKPYKRTSSYQYYENNYYYSNRTAKDTSIIMYVLFFIESLITHLIVAPKYNLNFGYLVLTWLVVGILPIIFIIKWALAPNFKKPTKVSLRLSLMLSIIVALNMALIIFLVGFFGFGADYSDINTMLLPIIIPLAFLINIPMTSIVYYLLYRSKRYNLR